LESLYFILEVEEFMSLPVDFRMEREKEIIDTYLTVGSICEINLPDTDRRTIISKMGTGSPDIFIEAQKYVTHMLIRNVDKTWKYNLVLVPIKEMKGAELKKEIDKLSDDQRIRDLTYFFLSGRLTPMMYQIRASVISLQNKLRTKAPIGHVHLIIKEFSGHTLSTTGITVYLNGKSFYKTSASTLVEKNTKTRTTPKYGQKVFHWNEKLLFEVKDVPTQGIELHLWEKRLTPNSLIGSIIIVLKDFITDSFVETESEIRVKLKKSGELVMLFRYIPNAMEVKRLRKEKEDKEKASRSVISPEYHWLT